MPTDTTASFRPPRGLVLRTKARIAFNALRGIRAHMWVHVVIGLFLVFGLIGGGMAFFHRVFDFLMSQEVFGPPLMDRLVGIIMLAFFSMLVFSNLIITLSTSYISREVDYLMALPISFPAIFRQKLIESFVYSSWAFAMLSFPFFVAFGASRGVEWFFYPLAALIVFPFLAIPALLGSIFTMIFTAFLPARKTRLLVAGLAGATLLLGLAMAQFLGIGRIFASADEGNFMQVMGFLEFGSSPAVPSTWLMQGLLAIAPADLGPPITGRYFYWLCMLSSTALFLYQVADWLSPRLYYKGWALSKDSANRTEASHARLSPFVLLDRMLAPFPSAGRALFSKDLKTFWRDPAQWTQGVVLFGLMVIYIANLRSAQRYSGTVEFLVTQWRTILAFFNLGSTCFILSILTTRFIYPMLSLEGRQFWAIGLAPMKRTAVVWQKYWLCVVSSLLFALSLLVFSNTVLQVDPVLQAVSIGVTIAMAFGLSSLSIGIGAILPNFREDNPARIANGLGGTANAFLSLGYIGATLALMVIPINYLSRGTWHEVAWWQTWQVPYIAGVILFHAAVIVVPMVAGLRRWERLEF